MSLNQPSQGGKSNSDDGRDWNNVFGLLTLGVLGSLAIVVGALAVVIISLQEDADKYGLEELGCTKSAYVQSSSSARKANDILIGIHATLTTGGGILVIPQNMTVYYYTAHLTKRLTFKNNEQDKFEMVNAFVALEVFAEYIARYYTGNGVKVLTNNNLSSVTSYTLTKNSGYKVLKKEITKRLEGFPICGEWEQVSMDDDLVNIADKLSKKEYFAAKEAMSAKYPDYFQEPVDVDMAVYKATQIVERLR